MNRCPSAGQKAMVGIPSTVPPSPLGNSTNIDSNPPGCDGSRKSPCPRLHVVNLLTGKAIRLPLVLET